MNTDTREPMTALEVAKFKAEAGNRPGLMLYRSDPDDEGAPVVIRKAKPKRPLMDQIDEVNRSHQLLTRKAALLRRVSALLDGDGLALRTLEPMVEALWRAEEMNPSEW